MQSTGGSTTSDFSGGTTDSENADDLRVISSILGTSSAIVALRRTLETVAPTDATVLVEGETGTGKELVARALHAASRRCRRPFVALNCAALPADLVESELFGHERGAFTGAHRERRGRFEAADGGTLFLDEVGELPCDAQAKLLRVLQERRLERIGSEASRAIDVRLVAATNRRLSERVGEGRFRADLFYRLSVFPITTPSLRSRPTDVPILACRFLADSARHLHKRLDGFTEAAMEHLVGQAWPGNVRELHNVVERAAILAKERRVDLEDCLIVDQVRSDEDEVSGVFLTLEETEKRHIRRALERTGRTIEGPRGAASLLGINASTLRSRIKRLGIDRP